MYPQYSGPALHETERSIDMNEFSGLWVAVKVHNEGF
jgi:hypothetical protein